MSSIDEMRKAFDDCTVMAGVEDDFECVYIVKRAALAILDNIEAENARLRSLLREAFDGGYTYGSECTRYGVDAVAYDWKHWLKEHDLSDCLCRTKGHDNA